MRDQLESLSFEYEFVEAIDKRNLTDRHYALYDDAAVQRRVGRSLTDGEIACALSHAEVWKIARERNLEQVIVLEDDAELLPGFQGIVEQLDLFPAGWDFLNFCTMAPQVGTGTAFADNHVIGQIHNKMSGTVAYCATRKALGTMLHHVFPLKAAADGLLSSLTILGKLHCYGTSPQIVKPSAEFTSSIWQDQTVREKSYCIRPDYVQRREPMQNFMDSSKASSLYQIDVYRKARAHYQSGRVLDIGCGVGDKLSEFFPEGTTLGLDLPPALDVARERHPDREWRQSDFSQIPEGKFSVVISADVIEHIFDPDDMLDFIDQIDFDLFVMSTPDRDTLPWGRSGPPRNTTHYREWSQPEFREYIGSRFNIEAQYQCPEPQYFSQVVEFTKKQ